MWHVIEVFAVFVVGVLAGGPSSPIAVRRLIDWDHEAKLPPWLSPIKEGSSQGVALVCGQSLRPDGKPPQVLIDRARMAKHLLDEKKVVAVIVSGGDPAGVGTTEASNMARVLTGEGINPKFIIQESQALTTAENAWFALRWIPEGTGQFYLITSDFHMARATYIFQEVFNYFYKMVEDAYVNNPAWNASTKRYPRLNISQVPTRSFCGSDASRSRDDDPNADIDFQSLQKRATDELRFLGSHQVADLLYGPPLGKFMYIWPVQINVTEDRDNTVNFQHALASAMNVAQSLCECKAPPSNGGPQLDYPLRFPIPISFPLPANQWKRLVEDCRFPQQQRLLLM